MTKDDYLKLADALIREGIAQVKQLDGSAKCQESHALGKFSIIHRAQAQFRAWAIGSGSDREMDAYEACADFLIQLGDTEQVMDLITPPHSFSDIH